MRRIKSKGMKPEMIVRQAVHAMGYRFRLHVPDLPGSPDLVFRSRKKIIEVRGCFWHQHSGCADAHIPKSREEYWGPKLRRNVERDQKNLAVLQDEAWQVLVIWECETTEPESLRRTLSVFLSS